MAHWSGGKSSLPRLSHSIAPVARHERLQRLGDAERFGDIDLRMRAHSDNAQVLAAWLQEQPLVERVHYCGLADHPGHELASRQQRRYGGVLAFEVAGGREAAWQFIDATVLMSLTANLGDAKTTIVHPATTTHGRLSEQQREEAGIIRV
ncbi:MAG: hypothetical protein CM15mP84_08950 [Cellvibrionales bacterium]|nr:MAG: hypothetical protein CM15mP84_08950 [Cellvibrionales bacterium]